MTAGAAFGALDQGSAQATNPERATSQQGTNDAYERLVRESPQGSIYCHRWWLDAVAPGQYQILEIMRGEDLVGAWPIVFRGSGKWQRCMMPALTQKLGILFPRTTAKYAEQLSRQHELIGEFIAQLPQEMGFYHRFHETFTNWLPFYWNGFAQTMRYTYILPNLSDEAPLWAALRPECRKGIRKAIKNGVTVTDSLSLERFIELHDMTYTRQGGECAVPGDLIRRVDAACCAQAGRRILAGIDCSGSVHAALYLLWDNGTAYYLMGGSDPELRGSGALKLLMWEAIRFARGVARRFDFEGSMIRPVEHTFRGFGAQQTPYFVIEKPGPLAPSLRGIARNTTSALKQWVRAKLRST